MNYPAFNGETISSESNSNNPNEEKVVKKSNEIYYEPRTGARYETVNGKFERLSENGDLVVGDTNAHSSEQTNSIRARGTFFGGKKSNPK